MYVTVLGSLTTFRLELLRNESNGMLVTAVLVISIDAIFVELRMNIDELTLLRFTHLLKSIFSS